MNPGTVNSPPSSARSCSSIASDLIGEERLTAMNTDGQAKKRVGSFTSVGEHGEDYLDVVFENFFGLHNEIEDIETSLTTDSPKVSPRPEEYLAALQQSRASSHSSQPVLSTSQVQDQNSELTNVVLKEDGLEEYRESLPVPLTMTLVGNSSSGLVQLAPSTLESKMQLKEIHDTQQQLFQNKNLLRKKIITFQVAVAVFEEVPEPEIQPDEVGSTASMNPPPLPLSSALSGDNRSESNPSPQPGKLKGGKEKTKEKEKTKKNNVMRHIYKTNCNAYRVQISVGSKVNPNGKFSRNTRLEKDALWLCELAILFIHHPASVEYLFHWGNYDFLLENGYCSSQEDYASTLTREFVDLTSRGLVKPLEFESIRGILSEFFPVFREKLTGLNISDIVSTNKKVKKATTAATKNKNSPKASAGKKSKVVIPVLQFPPSASQTADINAENSLFTEKRTNDKVDGNFINSMAVREKDVAYANAGSNVNPSKTDFGSQISNSSDEDGHDDEEEDIGAEVDIKRRRVPAINPTHQSPRTLEMYKEQQVQQSSSQNSVL